MLLFASAAFAAGIPETRWLEMPIEYAVDPVNEVGLDGDAAIYGIVESAAPWNEIVGADIDLSFRGDIKEGLVAYDTTHTVLFEQDWTLAPELLASTSVWSTAEGKALAFDIEINTRDHEWSFDGAPRASDFRNALTHEMGHALGLGHIDDPEATMYAYTADGETEKRDLATSDAVAALTLYAVDPDAIDAYLDGASCNHVGGAPSALALLLAACLRRKERPC